MKWTEVFPILVQWCDFHSTVNQLEFHVLFTEISKNDKERNGCGGMGEIRSLPARRNTESEKLWEVSTTIFKKLVFYFELYLKQFST
jgi:hypothetical protein